MSDLKLSIRLSTSGGKIVVKDLQQVDAAAEKLNNSLGAAGKRGVVANTGLTKASIGADKLASSSKHAAHEMGGMHDSMLLMMGGMVLLAGTINAISRTDSFNVLTQRIKTATKATGDFAEINAELYRITQANRSNFESTVEMFQRMSTARTELEATNAQMLKFTGAIQQLAVIGGTATANIKAGQTQLAQMLSSNVARAEEFNSILENTPEVAARMAKGLGMSVGKMREMMIAGKLLSKDVFQAILSQTEQIQQDFSGIKTSIAQAAQQASTSLDNALARLDKVTGNTSSIAEMLTDMSKTLDAMDVSELQDLAATIVAVAGGVSALVLLRMLNVNLITMAVSAGTATAGLTATTLATRTLAVATRTLLGPIGLALTAAYMLYEALSPDELDKTSAATAKLAEENLALARAQKKAKEAANEVIAPVSNLNVHLQKAYEERARLIAQQKVMATQQAAVTAAYGFSSKEAQGYQNAVVNISTQLVMQEDLVKSLLVALKMQADAQKQLSQDEFDKKSGGTKKLAQLQQQIALFGELGAVKKIAYQIEKGSLQGISTELAKQLTLETAKLEQLKKQQRIKANHQKDKGIITSLAEELALMRMSVREKAIYNNMRKLSANATQAERDQVIALTEAQLQQQQKQDDSAYYDNIINGANDIGQAWNSAGNVIIDTFGSIGQQLKKLSAQQQSYAEQQKKIAKDKLTYADNPKQLAKIGKAEEKLAQTRTSANLSSYAAISGAASKMFSENSKGRKALHAMEQVFTVAEVALAMQRAYANAIASIANQGNGDPYSAFARIAAMAAIMAGLGLAVSGGSGSAPTSAATRQQNQGTGTVLGSDDKSQSILNAFDRIESLALDQYAQLRQMNSTLNDLNNNIAHLAVSLVKNFGKFDAKSYGGELGSKSTTTKFEELLLGGVIGQFAKALDPTGIIGKIFSSFSSKKRSLMDSGISIVSQTLGDIIDTGLLQAQAYFDIKTKKKSFWGLSSSTNYNTETQNIDSQLQRDFALIFTNIGDSINNAIDVLGISVATETTSTFEKVLAGFNGNMADFDFSKVNFDQFFGGVTQQITEGATRSLDNFVIDLPNISFKDKTGEEIQKELEAVFSQQADLMAQYLVPQIGEFQQAGEGLYDTLLRVAQEQVIFNSVLELTAQSLNGIDANAQLDVAQSIIEFAGSIDALQSAANTYLNEFFTNAEQFDLLSAQLNDQFTALNVSLPNTRDGFKDLLGSLDLTKESDQRLYAALMLLIPQLDGYYDALEEQRKKAEQAAEAERKLAIARGEFVANMADQLAKMDMSPLEEQLFNLQRQFEDYRDKAAELGADTALLEKLYAKKRQKIIDDALAKVNDTNQRALDKLTNEHQRAVDNLTANNDRLISSFTNLNASIANSILTIRRDSNGWNELGYQAEQISVLRSKLGSGSIDEQLANITDLNTAILAKYQLEKEQAQALQTQVDELTSAQADLTSEYSQAVDSLTSNNERLINSIASVSSSIASSILKLKREMGGWNELGYQTSNVSSLRNNLGSGTIDEQLTNIDQLSTALNDKYQAELDQNRKIVNLANERYKSDLSNYQNLAKAAESLKKAADDLRFGDLSTFTSTEQFGFAKKAFNQALASGDVANLQNKGKQYLSQAKNYYGGTASSEYQAIFDKVTSSFGNASAGAAPSIPSEIAQYQQADIALQNDLLAELTSLQTLTDELDAQRAEQFNSEMATLVTTYETESLALQEQITSTLTDIGDIQTQLQTDTLAELQQLRTLTDELDAQRATQFETQMASLETAYNEGVAELAITLAEQTAEITNALGNIETAIGNIEPPKIVFPPPPKFPPIIIINDPKPLPPDQIQKQDNSSKVAVASHEKLGELVDLTKQQNARLEALEMRQAEQNSKNNKWQQIA